MKKSILSLVLIVCLAVNLVPIQSPWLTVEAANAISSNIAKGKTVWQTGTGWGQTSVTNAVDGSTSTEWNPGSHSAGGTAMVYMDLGSSAVKYNKIKVRTTQWNSSEMSLASSAALSGTHSISSNVSSAKLSSATTLFTDTFSPAKVYNITSATAGSGVTLPSSATAASTYERIFPTSTNRYVSLYNRVAASGINGNKISEIELYYAPPSTMSLDINTNVDSSYYDISHFDKNTNTYYYNKLAESDAKLQLRAWLYDSEGDSLTNDTTAFEGLTWWLGDTEGTKELNGVKLQGSGRFPYLLITPDAVNATIKINCKWVQSGYTTLTASMNLKLASTLSVANFANGTPVTNNLFSVVTGTATSAFTKNNLITRKTSGYSGEWNDMPNARVIQATVSPINDFSYYEYVNLWVYSKDATGTDIGVMFYSDGGSYYRRTFKLDFAGWKMIALPLSLFSANAKNGVSPTWSNITDFALTCSGWNSTAATAADKVCIDGIWMNSAYATWEKENEFDIINMNNANVITASGATANTTYTNTAKYSAAWGDMTATGSLKFTEIPRDWTTFSHIQFSIYSEAKTTENIKLLINTDAHEASGGSYFAIDIAIDWQGWKTFTYRTCDITPQRTAQLDEVSSITFVANGWGLTASATPRIYLDSMTAYRYSDHYGSAMPYKYETRNAFNNIQSKVNALSLGSDNILVAGTVQTVDGKVKNSGGVMLAPESAFTAFGYTVPSSITTQTIDGITYVPVEETLSSLSKTYWITPDEMIIIASTSYLNTFKKNATLTEYVHYMMTYKDNITLTDADFEQIVANLKDYYVGTSLTDVPEEYTKVHYLISRNEASAKTFLETVNTTDSANPPFTVSSTATNAEKAMAIYTEMWYVAEAYACPMSSYYKNTELKDALIYCLDWVCDNYYGEGNVESSRSGNWWAWEIGAPKRLSQIVLNLSDELTEAQIDKYLYPINYLLPRSFYTMANKTDQAIIVFIAAALQKDTEGLLAVRDSLDTVFRYNETSGDGFYRDGSFIQHSTVPYILGYGSALFISTIPILACLKNTKAEIVNPQSKNIFEWIFNSIEPIIFNEYGMQFTAGRNSSKYSGGPAISLLLPLTQLVDLAEDDDLVRLKKFIKRYGTSTFINGSTGVSAASTLNIYKLYEVVNDSSISADDYSITKVYPMMDRVVKNTNDFAVGISMNSARISSYESINGENMKGWYTSDGMVYIFTKASASLKLYGKEHVSYMNPYRMPGTTVDTKTRKEVSIQGAQSWLSDERFVGGVTLDERYATAAMQLDAYSYTGTDTSSTYNGGLPYFDCDLEAKKSWFIFDDEVVCLGADINSTKDNSVETTVENMRNKLTDEVTVDGTALGTTSTSSLTAENASWAHIKNTGGYVFPEKNKTLNVKRYSNTYNFTEMWFDHGKNPTGDTYSYIILPNKTAEETANYAENNDTTILANTATVQSVYDKSSDSTGTIFWSAGTFDGLTSDKPLVTMQNRKDGILTLAVSDPTHDLTSATVTIEKGLLIPEEVPENATVTRMGGKVKITYDLTNSKGSSYSVKFKDYSATEYSSGLIFEASSSEACDEFGLLSSTSYKLNYSQTGHLDGAADSGYIESANLATNVDWSEFTHINMWVYSENTTNSKINIIPKVKDGMECYARGYLPIDWTGWKLVSIPLSDFIPKENVGFTWDGVKTIKLYTDGWYGDNSYDSTAEELAKIQLYFDKIWLSKSAEGTLKSYDQLYSYDEAIGNISASVDIENTGVEEKSVRLIIAKYDENEKLISAEFKDVTVDAGEVITPTVETVLDNGEITTVKTFVWNDLTSITPLGVFGIFNLK